MKRSILTIMIMCGLAAAAQSPRSTVTIGSAVSHGTHSVVVGEPMSGTLGTSSSWHLTHGQLQGIAPVQTLSVDNIAEEPAAGYSIYPNPVHDVLNISRPDGSPATLAIFSLDGSLEMSLELASQTSAVDVTGLAEGLHLLSIRPANGASSLNVKIIKN